MPTEDGNHLLAQAQDVTAGFFSFVARAEKLKTVLRHSWTSDRHRQETVADHSWMVSLIALVLTYDVPEPVDRLRTIEMLLIHDLAEAITGDIPAFERSERQQSKATAERAALRRITEELPPATASHIESLFEEFENHATPEARLARALDKLEVLIQHNLAEIDTWDQGDYDIGPYYREDCFTDVDVRLRSLKGHVDNWTMVKIEEAGMLARVTTEHRERYEREQMSHALNPDDEACSPAVSENVQGVGTTDL